MIQFNNKCIGGRSSMIYEVIEIWADSFHEGEWCCDNLISYAIKQGYTSNKLYANGFMPIYIIKNSDIQIQLNVYGSYDSWENIPKCISELLSLGKSDFIAYSEKNDEIIFAVEETSATMTGNQPLQRCERQYGSAKNQIPFWYLVSEFGTHLDGGTRRDSIWPTISALKLSIKYEIPNMVLHYSGESSPEDYKTGKGLDLLFSSLLQYLLTYATKSNPSALLSTMEKQYIEMIDFVNSQWPNMIDFIPSKDSLNNKFTSRLLAYCSLGQKHKTANKLDGFLQWPLTTEVLDSDKINWKKSDLLTYDVLSEQLENDIERGYCYILSNNASSGRPPREEQIVGFLEKQKSDFNKAFPLSPPASYDFTLSSFSKTENGNYNLTTSKNILYLYDNWYNLKNTLYTAFSRLNGKLENIENEPVMVYISNSLAPRRIFGDPFIGQLTAYSIIFGKFDKRKRKIIAYYPHQSYTYFTSTKGKGKRIMSELVDYAIFAGGVIINVQTEEII